MFFLDYRNRLHRILVHILFWFAYLSFFTFLNWINTSPPYYLTWFRSLIFLPIDILATYITIYLLLPRLFLKKKYLLFALSFSFLGVVVIFLNQIVNYYIFIPHVLGKTPLHSFFQFSLWYHLVSTYAVVIFAASISISKMWLKEQQSIARLKAERAESELAMLKYQMNPHFIYNTLNNIDTLIQTNPDKASQSLIRLSEIMRYVTYDSDKALVTIQEEINYLKSFIELQKLRFGRDLIHFDVSIDQPGRTIAPMLFIPLVENAIKHGDKTNGIPAINIMLIVNESVLFSVTNFIQRETVSKDKVGGIGLKNLRRRLELIYPDNYSLTCDHTGGKTFTAKLWIK